MNINESINAINSINASFNNIPSRLNDSFHNPESQEGLENVLTDMKVYEHSYTANIKALKTMISVENILLEDLRNQE